MLLCCYELYDYMSYVRRWTSKQTAKLNWIVQEARLALANPTLPVLSSPHCPRQCWMSRTICRAHYYTLHTTHYYTTPHWYVQLMGPVEWVYIAPLRPCNWHIFQELTNCTIWEAENLSTLPLAVYVCHQKQPDIGFQATNCVFLSLRSWTVIKTTTTGIFPMSWTSSNCEEEEVGL